MNKYTFSSSFERILGSASARQMRAQQALASAGLRLLPIDCLRSAGSNHASTCSVKGFYILIDYASAVAFRHPDGSFVAVVRNFFSKTTDRTTDKFIGNARVIRVPVDRFNELLKEHLM